MTPDSNHGRKIYPNRARDIVLTGVDQILRADITYIRLQDELVILAVFLDAYSRRVIGWRWSADGAGAPGGPTRGWCTTPTAARSTPAPTTPSYSKRHRLSMSRKVFQEDPEVTRKSTAANTGTWPMRTPRSTSSLKKVYNPKRLHSALGYIPWWSSRPTPPAAYPRGSKLLGRVEALCVLNYWTYVLYACGSQMRVRQAFGGMICLRP